MENGTDHILREPTGGTQDWHCVHRGLLVVPIVCSIPGATLFSLLFRYFFRKTLFHLTTRMMAVAFFGSVFLMAFFKTLTFLARLTLAGSLVSHFAIAATFFTFFTQIGQFAFILYFLIGKLFDKCKTLMIPTLIIIILGVVTASAGFTVFVHLQDPFFYDHTFLLLLNSCNLGMTVCMCIVTKKKNKNSVGAVSLGKRFEIQEAYHFRHPFAAITIYRMTVGLLFFLTFHEISVNFVKTMKSAAGEKHILVFLETLNILEATVFPLMFYKFNRQLQRSYQRAQNNDDFEFALKPKVTMNDQKAAFEQLDHHWKKVQKKKGLIAYSKESGIASSGSFQSSSGILGSLQSWKRSRRSPAGSNGNVPKLAIGSVAFEEERAPEEIELMTIRRAIETINEGPQGEKRRADRDNDLESRPLMK